MTAPGRLFAPPDSPAAGLARMLAWLWRLGPVEPRPDPGAVGLAGPEQGAELARLVRERRLAGAAILAGAEGPELAPVPARRQVAGPARFPTGERVLGPLGVFAGGAAVVRSSLGAHAVRDGDVLALAAPPDGWRHLRNFWALPALASFLAERLGRPLVLPPALGCLRVDDPPGTAELQLLGRARADAAEERRVRAIVAAVGASARLVIAVPARALADGRPVPVDELWPRATTALAEAAASGVVEPACHGLLHLDTEALAAGRVDPREFAHLDRDEAGRRLDEAIAWMTPRLGAPRSFAPPAWGCSAGTLAAARERGLPTWAPPWPAPLLDDGRLRETQHVGLPGLHGVDFTPLLRLSAAGLPPTVVFHGRLLDDRLPRIRERRDLRTLLRIAVRRDLARIARLPGIRWVGAAELVSALRAHSEIELEGGHALVPDGVAARLLRPDGTVVPAP